MKVTTKGFSGIVRAEIGGEAKSIKAKAQVLLLLQASINLIGARTAIEAAGESTIPVNSAIHQVDEAIKRRLRK